MIVGLAIATNRWLVLAGVAFLPLVLLWPLEVALGSFGLLVPFDAIAILGQGRTGTTLTAIAGAAAGGIALGVGLAFRRFDRPPKAAFWLGALVVLAAATSVWAIDSEKAVARIPSALALFFVYLVVVSIRYREEELSRISLAVVAGGCIAALYSCYLFYSGTYFQGTTRSSLVAGERGTDPNYFAASLLMPLALAVGYFLASRSSIAKWVMIAAAALMAFGILLTMSRGGLLALAIMVLVFMIRMHVNWRMLVAGGIIASGLWFMPGLFFTRIQQAETGNVRLQIWLVGLHALKQYGAFGAGVDNFPDAFAQNAGNATREIGSREKDSHNTYLRVAVETGFLGLVFFILALRSHFRDMWSHIQLARGELDMQIVAYEAGLIGVLAAGFFIDLIWNKTLWLALMLAAMVVRTRTLIAETEPPAPEYELPYEGPIMARAVRK